jgi:hypothetical protein
LAPQTSVFSVACLWPLLPRTPTCWKYPLRIERARKGGSGEQHRELLSLKEAVNITNP